MRVLLQDLTSIRPPVGPRYHFERDQLSFDADTAQAKDSGANDTSASSRADRDLMFNNVKIWQLSPRMPRHTTFPLRLPDVAVAQIKRGHSTFLLRLPDAGVARVKRES